MKKKLIFKIFIKLLFTIVIINSVQAQLVNQEWVARYNGTGNLGDVITSSVIDDTGNVYLTGRSIGNGGREDYATIKYNSSGIQQWVMRYNGPGDSFDYANSIAVDNSGNVYVTGTSFGTSDDYATIKYNSSGIQQWVIRYNGPTSTSDESAWAIALDGSGNIYVTGQSEGVGTNYDYVTIKYNSSGIQQWITRYNGPGNHIDRANAIAVDSSGNVYVTGFSKGNETGIDYATVKYNTEGIQQWARRYSASSINEEDAAWSISLDDIGNVYVTGNSRNGSVYPACATIKYNTDGDDLWVARYSAPGNSLQRGNSVKVDDLGNVYVVGQSGILTYDFFTIKYNYNGIEQWVSRHSGGLGKSIALDKSGYIYVTGFSSDGFETYLTTIKYDSFGIQQWITNQQNDVSGFEKVNIDLFGNVIVTGASDGDYITIKYSQTISIQQLSTELPEQFSLYQNYPNPFNPTTKIKFDIEKAGIIKLKVFDILGKEIATLVNESLNSGSYETEFDGSNIMSGVYFYKLETDNFSEVKRMILTK